MRRAAQGEGWAAGRRVVGGRGPNPPGSVAGEWVGGRFHDTPSLEGHLTMPKGEKHGGRRLAPNQPEQARYGNTSRLEHGLRSLKPPALAELPQRLKASKIADYAGDLSLSLLSLAERADAAMPALATQDDMAVPSKLLYQAQILNALEHSIRGGGIKPAPYGDLSGRRYRRFSSRSNRTLRLQLAQLLNGYRFFEEQGVVDAGGRLRTSALLTYSQQAGRAGATLRMWAAGRAWLRARKLALDSGDMMRRIDALVNEEPESASTEN